MVIHPEPRTFDMPLEDAVSFLMSYKDPQHGNPAFYFLYFSHEACDFVRKERNSAPATNYSLGFTLPSTEHKCEFIDAVIADIVQPPKHPELTVLKPRSLIMGEPVYIEAFILASGLLYRFQDQRKNQGGIRCTNTN